MLIKGIHCLILVEPQPIPNRELSKRRKKTKIPSPLKKFALLPAKSVKHPFSKILSQNNIEIIENGQVIPPESLKLEFVEILLVDSPPETQMKLIRVYVHRSNQTFVQQLLTDSSNVIKVMCASDWQFSHATYATVDEVNLKALEQLLIDKVDITPLQQDAGSFLHIAVNRGYYLTQLLLKHVTDVNAVRKDGATPLHIAVSMNCLKTVKILVEYGACLDVKKHDGCTLLHEAAKIGSSSIIKYLVECSADINVMCADGSTPLHQALWKMSPGVVQFLVQKGAEVTAKTKNGITPLHIAAGPGMGSKCIPIIELLLQKGADIHATDVKGNTPLHCSVRQFTDVLKFLVERGADVNIENGNGATVLLKAVTENWIAMCEYLLSVNPDVNVVGNRKAFVRALCKGDKFKILVERMIQQGFRAAAEDAKDPEVLFGAIHKGSPEIVRSFLQYGANVHEHRIFMSLSVTPLHYAIRTNQQDIVLVLLEHGADVTAKRGLRQRECLPITDAALCANMEIMNMLVAKGVRLRDEPTLLHLATENPCSEVLQFLLKEGFDWNAKNFKGETPLSIAAKKGNLKAVEIMVNFGAQVDVSYLPIGLFSDSTVLKQFLQFCFPHPNPAGKAVIHQIFRFNYGYSLADYSCIEALAKHLVKLGAVDEALDEVCVRDLIPSHCFEVLSLDEFENQCKLETNAMELKKIGLADVTVHDILTKSVSQIAGCARNPDFCQWWESCDAERNYPIYGSILTCKARQGCLRRQLLDLGVKILDSYSQSFFTLPHDLKEILIAYLNNQDLFILQKSQLEGSVGLQEVMKDFLNNKDNFILPKFPQDMASNECD